VPQQLLEREQVLAVLTWLLPVFAFCPRVIVQLVVRHLLVAIATILRALWTTAFMFNFIFGKDLSSAVLTRNLSPGAIILQMLVEGLLLHFVLTLMTSNKALWTFCLMPG